MRRGASWAEWQAQIRSQPWTGVPMSVEPIPRSEARLVQASVSLDRVPRLPGLWHGHPCQSGLLHRVVGQGYGNRRKTTLAMDFRRTVPRIGPFATGACQAGTDSGKDCQGQRLGSLRPGANGTRKAGKSRHHPRKSMCCRRERVAAHSACDAKYWWGVRLPIRLHRWQADLRAAIPLQERPGINFTGVPVSAPDRAVDEPQ